MCGRLLVEQAPIVQWLAQELAIDFKTKSNRDLRPSQTIDIIRAPLTPEPSHWGIQPSWAKRLIINAQSETVATKKTFKTSFESKRCLVPCSGWYEWRQEHHVKKRYLFTHNEKTPLLMAGIWFDSGDQHQLVTLTTQALGEAEEYHPRMPLFIDKRTAQSWLNGSSEQALNLLQPYSYDWLKVEPFKP